MWYRLALMAAIMHPRKPLYITQMSDFLKVFSLSVLQHSASQHFSYSASPTEAFADKLTSRLLKAAC
jgi:hypothetical protein